MFVALVFGTDLNTIYAICFAYSAGHIKMLSSLLFPFTSFRFQNPTLFNRFEQIITALEYDRENLPATGRSLEIFFSSLCSC